MGLTWLGGVRGVLVSAVLMVAPGAARAAEIVFSGVGENGATLSGSAEVDQTGTLGFAPLALSAAFSGLPGNIPFASTSSSLADSPLVYYEVDPVNGSSFTLDASRLIDHGMQAVSCAKDCVNLFGGTGANRSETNVVSFTGTDISQPASAAVLGLGLAGFAWRRRMAAALSGVRRVGATKQRRRRVRTA